MDEEPIEEGLDLRDVQPEPEPEPAAAPAGFASPILNYQPKDLSVRHMFYVMGTALAVLGVFLFFTLWLDRPAVNAETYRPTCPNGQPLPHGSLCPKIISDPK